MRDDGRAGAGFAFVLHTLSSDGKTPMAFAISGKAKRPPPTIKANVAPESMTSYKPGSAAGWLPLDTTAFLPPFLAFAESALLELAPFLLFAAPICASSVGDRPCDGRQGSARSATDMPFGDEAIAATRRRRGRRVTRGAAPGARSASPKASAFMVDRFLIALVWRAVEHLPAGRRLRHSFGVDFIRFVP